MPYNQREAAERIGVAPSILAKWVQERLIFPKRLDYGFKPKYEFSDEDVIRGRKIFRLRASGYDYDGIREEIAGGRI